MQRGFGVDYQVGVAGYRLDLAVSHPDYRNGYLVGVECDGATYHSSRSARDRDVLRQEILEKLGWTIYRIWSTDWFTDPPGQMTKLCDYLEARFAAGGSLAGNQDPEIDFDRAHDRGTGENDQELIGVDLELTFESDPEHDTDQDTSELLAVGQSSDDEKYPEQSQSEDAVSVGKVNGLGVAVPSSADESALELSEVAAPAGWECSACGELFLALSRARVHIKRETNTQAKLVGFTDSSLADGNSSGSETTTLGTQSSGVRPPDSNDLVCVVCGRQCRTASGLQMHIDRNH